MIVIGAGFLAKRIVHQLNSNPPKVVIRSVTLEYETYERDAEEVHMNGHVVWMSRRL